MSRNSIWWWQMIPPVCRSAGLKKTSLRSSCTHLHFLLLCSTIARWHHRQAAHNVTQHRAFQWSRWNRTVLVNIWLQKLSACVCSHLDDHTKENFWKYHNVYAWVSASIWPDYPVIVNNISKLDRRKDWFHLTLISWLFYAIQLVSFLSPISIRNTKEMYFKLSLIIHFLK